MQYATVDQKEREEEPTYTTIAVEKWGDRLKLCVRETAVNQVWKRLPIVQEHLKVLERLVHRGDRRGYKRRLAERYIGCTDPVLSCAELPRTTIGTADAGSNSA